MQYIIYSFIFAIIVLLKYGKHGIKDKTLNLFADDLTIIQKAEELQRTVHRLEHISKECILEIAATKIKSDGVSKKISNTIENYDV